MQQPRLTWMDDAEPVDPRRIERSELLDLFRDSGFSQDMCLERLLDRIEGRRNEP